VKLLVILAIAACAPRSNAEKSHVVTVRGKIREISTIDLSKKAGVPNLYTEILLDVDEVTPAERKAAISREVVFFKQGKLELANGAHVEFEVDTLDWNQPKRLRILKFKTL
jgi:hypothetical protein